jgi:hypothetical protein
MTKTLFSIDLKVRLQGAPRCADSTETKVQDHTSVTDKTARRWNIIILSLSLTARAAPQHYFDREQLTAEKRTQRKIVAFLFHDLHFCQHPPNYCTQYSALLQRLEKITPGVTIPSTHLPFSHPLSVTPRTPPERVAVEG